MKNFIPVNRPLFSNLEKKYLLSCIKTGWISSSGKFIEQFENSFKKIVLRKYAVAVSSGTAALDIAIKTLKFDNMTNYLFLFLNNFALRKLCF